jgi:o-succinylbenzoate synthase
MMITCDISEKILHFYQPAGTSRGVYTTRRSWFVSLTDDERPGVVGVGECAPLPQLSCDDLPDYQDILRGFCEKVVRDGVLDTEALRPYPSMLFGLETAWRSLQARSVVIFDTPFTRGEVGIPINGLVWMGSYEEMMARMEEKMAAGFRCIKLKIGAIDFDHELDLIRRIRECFSEREVELRLDANGAFATDEALKRLGMLANYGIHSIEQPIRQGQWEEMAHICTASPIPIALDEELIGIHSLEEKAQLLDIIRPEYIILKPSLHGGITGTLEWISLAEQRGIGSWITSALESNVGLSAVAQLAAHAYGAPPQMPQGLGTGQLFADNIPMPMGLVGDRLFFYPQRL